MKKKNIARKRPVKKTTEEERKKYIKSLASEKTGTIGTLHLSLDDEKCYFCGRTTEDFNSETGFDKLELEYHQALQQEKASVLEAINEKNAIFVETHKSVFESVNRDLQVIPDALNNLSLKEIIRQKGTLVKLHPELANLAEFHHFRQGYITDSKLDTLGKLKTAYQEIMEDFSHNIVKQRTRTGVKIPEDNPIPEYLLTLSKLNRRIKQIDEDTRFRYSNQERQISFRISGRAHDNISITYHVCPICYRMIVPPR